MKLRNKKTGEIIETDFELSVSIPENKKLFGSNTYTQIKGYSSIKELSEEWEDVTEEPKEHWYIDWDGKLMVSADEEGWEAAISIGNYFESKKEAKKAVEKLKALTEAKEDGLKIKGYYYNHEDLVILADIGKCNKLTLDTLFGKEID